MSWAEAPKPRWLHRCKVAEAGWIELDFVERCACGAMRVRTRFGNRWFDRNSR